MVMMFMVALSMIIRLDKEHGRSKKFPDELIDLSRYLYVPYVENLNSFYGSVLDG